MYWKTEDGVVPGGKLLTWIDSAPSSRCSGTTAKSACGAALPLELPFLSSPLDEGAVAWPLIVGSGGRVPALAASLGGVASTRRG